MRLKLAAAAISLCALTTADAQTMYRCGSTYSQTPCGSDAKEVRAAGVPQPVVPPPMPAADAARVADLTARCVDALRNIPAWKDRDGLKIEKPQRSSAPVVREINGVRRAVIPYYSSVNGRNSYGAYTGEKFAACYFDMEETKLLDLNTGS